MDVPYGVVSLDASRLVDYREKPTYSYHVSSGTYVLGASALAAVDEDSQMSIPDLITKLLSRDERIVTFEHAAEWVDVNDASAVERAEVLVAEHGSSFEKWWPTPDKEVSNFVMLSPAGVLVRRTSASDEHDLHTLAIVDERKGLRQNSKHVVSLDIADTDARLISRHHIYAASSPASEAVADALWVGLEGLSPADELSRRCVAWLRRGA